MCEQAMEPDNRIIQMPCCPAEYHTQCYINHLSLYYHANCLNCGTVFFNVHGMPAGTAETAETDQSSPEFRAAVRNVKKANTARNKALTALKRSVNEVALGFKAQSAPLIASLTAMKREAMAAVKLTDNWRTGTTAVRRASTLLTRFVKKYSVDHSSLGNLDLRQRWCHRYNNPIWLLRRKFRIKI